MTRMRKKAFGWALLVTAFLFAGLTGSFVYLHEKYVGDPKLVEARVKTIASERGFKLEDARKDGYSDTEIADFFATANRAEFDHRWSRILFIFVGVYLTLIFSIVAATLLRESKGTQGPS